MAKQSAGKSQGNREPLVVASKVKAFIKEQDCLTSGELIDALNSRVYELLEKAVERAKMNKRSTVKAQDV
jgi:histone H3/H4